MQAPSIAVAIASLHGGPLLAACLEVLGGQTDRDLEADVSYDGGVFATSVLPRGSVLEQGLVALNARVITGMGHWRGVAR